MLLANWFLDDLLHPLGLFGLAAQAMFMLRFVVQWFASERGLIANFQVTGYHAHNSVVIGNDVWMVEPQTGEIWFWGNLE